MTHHARPPVSSGPAILEDWLPLYKQLTLGIAYVWAFASGMVIAFDPAATALSAMCFASALTLWCDLDARSHGKIFVHSFGWQLMWTWPIGMLVHLIWTRGARGIVTYLILAAGGVVSAGAGRAFVGVLHVI